MGGGRVPHSAYRMNFLNKEASIFMQVTRAKGQPKPRQQLRGFETRLDARISPPADEYYIMRYEDPGPSMASGHPRSKDKTIVVAPKGALLNGSKFKSEAYLA